MCWLRVHLGNPVPDYPDSIPIGKDFPIAERYRHSPGMERPLAYARNFLPVGIV